MALRNYLLVLSLLLFVTFGNSFNMKYVMDRLNVIETKFDAKMDALENKLETENKLRRLEVDELFRIISQLTGVQLLTKTEDALPAENLSPSQQLTSVSPSMEKYKPSQLLPDLQNLQSYLIRGAKSEKEENVKIRTELSGIGKKLENDYVVFQSKIKDEIRNITHLVSEKQNLLVNETRQSLNSFKSDVKASILEFSSSLRDVNETAAETVQRCINISDSSAILTTTAMFEMRNETRQYLNSLKSDVEASNQLLKPLIPKSCKSASDRNGVLSIYPETLRNPIQVYCDQRTDGGGWLVIQRRQDGSVDFERTWADYKTGFGNLEGEFWIGNENLHYITSAGLNELRIDMEDFEGNRRYAKYNTFNVKSESEKYVIEVSGYSGDAGDSLAWHNHMPFSTKDRDNDNFSGESCSVTWRGAWWYNNCHYCNLNGYYYRGAGSPNSKGVVWYYWKGWEYSLKRVEMKIR